MCRGCKRFSHEVHDWNQLEKSHKDIVWQRLRRVYHESIQACVRVHDRALFDTRLTEFLTNRPDDTDGCIYELLQQVNATAADLGLKPVDSPNDSSSLDLFQEIEREIYDRSLAYYEYTYKQKIDQI